MKSKEIVLTIIVSAAFLVQMLIRMSTNPLRRRETFERLRSVEATEPSWEVTPWNSG